MKFGRRFENSKIPEWADFYISYRALKKLLSPYKVLRQYYLRSKIEDGAISVHNFSSEEIQQLEYFGKAFEKLLFHDLEKMLSFYTIKLNQIIAKWRKLRLNVIIFKQRTEILTPDVKDQYYSMIRESFQALIKEIKLLSDYINVNLEGFQKILKKQKKAVSQFNTQSANLKSKFEKYLTEVLRTKAVNTRDRLNNFLFSVENEYVDFFYKNRSEGMKELRKIFQGNLISRNETFWFGLFFGFSAILVCVIIALIWNEGLDIDGDEIFTKIFPIFRGIGLIFVFIWLLAWNVYVWTAYHVNYKLIFRFNYHYSQISEILKRASAFSTVLLVMLLWYLILEGKSHNFSASLLLIPKEIIPLFVWLVFIGYVFFPHKRMFNGQGRIYIFNLLKNILMTPFISVNFPIIWATDQLASFVVPLKDLQYTICFYTTYFFYNKSEVDECRTPEGLSKGVILAVIPLILRYFQCLRQCYDAGTLKIDATVNSFKYLFSLFVAILSYYSSVNPKSATIFNIWIVFAVISTIYSYTWDLKKDWGFLVPGAKFKFLRNQLSYNKPSLYYTMITANLLMRLVWVLSISPDLLAQIIRPELFALIVGFVEIFRRSVWNFLRVEKEHLANVGNFKAVPDMNLPFTDINYDNTLREEDVFAQDLKVIIENDSKLGKPILSSNEQSYNKASMVRKSSFHADNNDQNTNFKSDLEEHSKLKMLTKITSEPTAILKPRDKEILVQDLIQYRQDNQQVELWAKEVTKFKHYLIERANYFKVVPIYKDLKLLHTKTKPPEDIDASINRFMKKVNSKSNFAALHERLRDDDEISRIGNHRTDEEMSEIGFIGSVKKLSIERVPLFLEMRQISVEQTKGVTDR